jgi:hypothetical protein
MINETRVRHSCRVEHKNYIFFVDSLPVEFFLFPAFQRGHYG